MQCIEDLLHGMNRHKIMSTLNLTSGYYQMPIREQDIPKMAFVQPSGCYAFLRMRFGLSSAPCIFQRLMDQVLQPILNKYALVYLDDIIIASDSVEEHAGQLSQVFTLLQQTGNTVKLEKFSFGRKRNKVLRLQINPGKREDLQIKNGSSANRATHPPEMQK